MWHSREMSGTLAHMPTTEPSSVQEPEFISTLIPDDKSKRMIRHVLRFPPEGSDEQMHGPLYLGCDPETLVFGRQRRRVPVSKIDCPACRKLTGW